MAIHRAVSKSTDVEADIRRIRGEFLRFDPESGWCRLGVNPDPLVFIWAPRVFEFLQVLESVVPYPPGRGMCREVGYRSGLDAARVAPRMFGISEADGLRVLLAMPRTLASAGWGLSELACDDEAERVEWSFPKGTAVGVAGQRAGRRRNPACAYFEGFGAGWIKGSLGFDVELLETESRSVGDGACRFVSRRTA